ncbi:hypothetical protein LTR37_013899 [Vermiconidia calcicola]|uniref:Uncharacterized protein n=1 Tax=Vermiconidia calcicola TaxID=1690605 RepID=A0ACC3MVD2_9PEZI|nr:hypothetical protein LTR37_013899 [Vermiconidia calcicola]
MSQNQAAWLQEKGTALKVGDAPMPTPGPDEMIVENRAIAINPLDWHMQDHGIFVKEWPAILGCDVAGQVYEVGANVTRFEKGDRVVGHTINLVTGKSQDAAFALFSVIPAAKAASLPDKISFVEGAVLPLALETAVTGLSLQKAGTGMMGIPTPALGLPYPPLEPEAQSKIIVVCYGGSSSVGSMATQLATAGGLNVVAIASSRNFELCRTCGASEVYDHADGSLVEKIVKTVRAQGGSFAGIFDAISIPSTYAHDLEILAKLGGGHLACTHPPPENVPDNVKAGMVFGVNDVADAVWETYVTPALESGKLRCLPQPSVVGKGLEYIQEALEKSKAGVSASKLVVEL